MEIVINKCYGGFSISLKAIKRMAELKGRKCYFFDYDIKQEMYTPTTLDLVTKWSTFAFDIPNPNDELAYPKRKNWLSLSTKEREEYNRKYESHLLPSRPTDRTDADLIRVIRELGEEANGHCAELEIIEIPDGIEYNIDEYDGVESVHEVHRSWG